MSLPAIEKTFVINEIGSVTKEKYYGTFVVKAILSKKEELLADLRRRMILGPNPTEAMVGVANDAYVLSQLHVRITKAPSWWNPNRDDPSTTGGLDLLDDNIIAAVYVETVKAETEWREEVSKAATEAEETVKKAAAKVEQPDEKK